MENISDIKNYQKLVFENLNKCLDIDMVIVKGQIIIEHHINRFILASIKNPDEYDDTKFTFSQKIHLSFMLGLITDLKEELNLINKLRNEIAHKLSYNENHLMTLFARISTKYPYLKSEKSQKVSMLKSGIAFICGALYAAVGINRPEFLKILDKEIEGNSITEK